VTTTDQIRSFIGDELVWDGEREELTDDLPLLERHVLDSMGIFNLVSFIESEFGVEVLEEELVPQHFGSIRAIAELIEAKRSA